MARFAPVRLVLSAILASLALMACSRHETAANPKEAEILANPGPPVSGDWVISRMDSDADTLNPLIAQTADANNVISVISEGLLKMSNYTLKLEPCLA
ncbi:MAG TPA: hypothetical protein VHY09_10640, partial [Candidatus Methylacidiphilales bacterium]|nr:hypothetical protein [Candidatus Methylacidiphilales bacterium]